MVARKSVNPIRLDDQESAFFKRELEFVKVKTYDTKYKKLKAFDIFPISTEAQSGNTEITYQVYSGIGFAKIIADYGKDFPRVDVFGEENTVKIYDLGDSYGYSIKEIRRSRISGKRLDQRKAGFAKKAMDQETNRIALTGDDDYNIVGFIDNPNITEYTIINDGTSSSKTWASKTPDQIIRDMNGIVTAVMDSTNGVEVPDTILLPLEQFNYIVSQRMTGDSSETIMSFFLKTNPYIKTIDWLVELKDAGTGSTDRIMVYTKDDDHLTLEIPQPFEQFPPEQEGMTFKISCHAETAGVLIYYPLSVAFGDGI